jgi:hypothetical protein
MLNMLYGYTPTPHTFDPLVALINRTMNEFGQAVVSGAWLVDVLPWLRFLPDWVPGAGFKRTARQWKHNLSSVVNIPVDFVQQQVTLKTAKPSYVSGLLGEPGRDISSEEMHRIKYSAMALYGGGADTTVATLNFFFLAMTVFPEVQWKAQEVNV